MNAVPNSTARRARRISAGSLLLWALVAPAMAAALPAGAGKLSPRLAKLTTPALRSAAPEVQADRLSLAPDGPGSLLRDGGRILVTVRFDREIKDGVEAIRGAGAEIVQVSRGRRTVTAAARPADLAALGAVAGVAGVTEILTPVVRGADCGGAVRSEGDTQLGARAARADFGVDGSGVTVGILSDSFDRDGAAATHAGGDVASGDLPGPGSPCGSTVPVGILGPFGDAEAKGDDEGRAMAQIVHDLAPGATIDFATAFLGEANFAASIRQLAAAGAKVIADDVAYLEEPFFQDGPVAVAVNEVSAAGVSYFSAAGNDNTIVGGENVGSYEAPFRNAGSCPLGVPAGEGAECADFNPDAGSDDAYDLTVEPGAEVLIDLQWAEPWDGVATDLDAFLLGETGEVLASASDRNVAKTQRPFELLAWENEKGVPVAVRLAIPRFDGAAAPRFKFIQFGNGNEGVFPTAGQFTSSSGGDVLGPTVFGHAGAAGAIAVGAVNVGNDAEPEEFSSRGPVTHLFGPVAGSSPAAPIAEQTIAKPDLVASDCGVTTFFSFQELGAWRFCGTSASAPHAAAVAALVRQANPGAGGGQIRADLTATARPLGGFGVDEVGAGLIDARAAVDALALAPAITITKAPAALSQNRSPTIEFTANRPVAFSCAIDGAAPQPCASPYQVPVALADGRHGFAVSGTDISGRAGSSGVVPFSVDTRAPQTSIATHPPKLIRTHRRRAKAVFRFRSSEPGSTFVCKVDRELLRFCQPRFALRVREGRHVVRVRARDEAGNVDSTATVFHFRVKRLG